MSETLGQLRARVLEDQETPEPVRRALECGASLESIRLDERGRWWHEGEAFANERLSLLFSKSLFQTAGGVWFLRIGAQSYPVTVEGAGAFAVQLWCCDADVRLTLSTGEEALATGGVWISDGEERLGIRLADGRDVRLVGRAHQEALSRVEFRDGGWELSLPQGRFLFESWPAEPRGRRLQPGDEAGLTSERSAG